MTATTTPELSSLRLPNEPNHYGAETRSPAPEWLIDATPGADKLYSAFKEARSAADETLRAERAAIIAFRAASSRNSSEWEPSIDIEYDKWRQLKAKMHAAATDVYSAARPVERTWHELRDCIEASAEARVEANRVVDERHTELVAAIDNLDATIARFGEANRLTSSRYARSEGPLLYTLDADLAKASREFRAAVAPEKPWTRG